MDFNLESSEDLKDIKMEEEAAKIKKQAEPEQDASVTGMLNNFASSTTAHGISRIASASSVRFKVAWFIIWVTVMAFFIYLVVTLVLLYKSKPVSTSINVKYETLMVFPGVTVCNMNILRNSRLRELKSGNESIFVARNSDNDDETYSTIQVPTVRTSSSPTSNASSIKRDAMQSSQDDYFANINDLSIKTRYERAYAFEDLIKFCTIDGLTCHDEGYLKETYWRKSWNWRYGSCYTFNGFTRSRDSKDEIRPLSVSSDSSGLRLTLDIIKSDYVDKLANEEGVRILIHDQDTVLQPYEDGFTVAPGVIAGIGLKKTVLTREDNFNNGSCRSGMTKSRLKYSLKNCVHTCKANTLLRLCSCIVIRYMALYPETKTCSTPAEKQCFTGFQRNFSNGVLDCSSKCPQQCRQVQYGKTITNGKIYADAYLSTVGSVTTVGKNKNKATPAYVLNSIVQLRIYFTDNTVQEINTETYYKFDNLISDIGGQLGLWIGVSAVTIAEFLALTWNLFNYLCNRGKVDKQKVNAK
eukprot:gene20038-22004_t